jgi:hypothetical protein
LTHFDGSALIADFEGLSGEAFELSLTGRSPAQVITIRHSEIRPIGFLDLDNPAVGNELAAMFARKASLSWPGAVLRPREKDFVVLLREPMNIFMVEGMKQWVRETLGEIALRRHRCQTNATGSFPVET